MKRPALSRRPPATLSPPAAFGFYWEMVHDRSGDVVGDGFCRSQPPALLDHPGYSYRITPLHRRLARAAWQEARV